MQEEFDFLKAFDFDAALVHLWVFKVSSTDAKFSARYVQTDDDLNIFLKNNARLEVKQLTECAQYTHLAENNACQCLGASFDTTDFSLLKNLVDRPEPEHIATKTKHLQGAQGYLAKFSLADVTIYAVRRSMSTWKTSYKKNHINLIFKNGELSASENNGFSIDRKFDMFCVKSYLLITNKRGFESVMHYKFGYASAFTTLQAKPEFLSLFTNMQPLIDYVGENAMQLKRMATVEEKGLYGDPGFLAALQAASSAHNWEINFDPVTNRIIPCAVTARTILQVLLDHRLLSIVTQNMYDVPNAVLV